MIEVGSLRARYRALPGAPTPDQVREVVLRRLDYLIYKSDYDRFAWCMLRERIAFEAIRQR